MDKPNFIMTADQAVYVFTTLLEFILFMRRYGYCHSDIKPSNILLVGINDNSNSYILKIIDLGSVTKDKL